MEDTIRSASGPVPDSLSCGAKLPHKCLQKRIKSLFSHNEFRGGLREDTLLSVNWEIFQEDRRIYTGKYRQEEITKRGEIITKRKK